MEAEQSLHTMVFDFHGGTDISQETACAPQDAVLSRTKGLRIDEIDGLGPKTKAEIISFVGNEDLAAIVETTNVWCTTFFIRGHCGLLNVIKTESL